MQDTRGTRFCFPSPQPPNYQLTRPRQRERGLCGGESISHEEKSTHTHTNDIIKARNNLGFHKTVLKLFEKGERSVFIVSFFFAKRNSIYHNSNEVEGNIRKEIMHAPLNLNTVPLLYSLSIGVMIESEYGELL